MAKETRPLALGVETYNMTMQFGAFTALDGVSMKVAPGSFHALLGENGAGKSTLVKCIMGFYTATYGALLVDEREVAIADPRDAQKLGMGMVYQHFTLVPSLTAAENLVIARGNAPSIINWKKEREGLEAFLKKMPFSVPLDRKVSELAAGEKQKLEILKQLYLGSRFLILDEPTSVLTPAEADEVLGYVRALTTAGELSVLMITHKFREVRSFADEVTVLRRGKLAGKGRVSELSDADMAEMMMGKANTATAAARLGEAGREVLRLENVRAPDRSGLHEIVLDNLTVCSREIVGVAGISGNGQFELMEILTGQRKVVDGEIRVEGKPYHGRRKQARQLKVRYLPEEPLLNACAPRMSVAENLALRSFDGNGRRFFLKRRAMMRKANDLIGNYDIRTRSASTPVRDLSGGNVQRVALARELSGEVNLLVVANPCFGLDFSAARAIRDRIIEARNAGAAVLLISEDLDEILELADRIVVMADGAIVWQGQADADPALLGRYMAGQTQ